MQTCRRRGARVDRPGGPAGPEVAGPVFPPAAALAPAFKAAEALAVALFGIFAADGANTV